jgi:hypothetical protein
MICGEAEDFLIYFVKFSPAELLALRASERGGRENPLLFF